MSYFENVYKSLLQSIKDNYEIDDISDYIVIDASFLLDSFCHIKLESKKCLGIFTQMYAAALPTAIYVEDCILKLRSVKPSGEAQIAYTHATPEQLLSTAVVAN